MSGMYDDPVEPKLENGPQEPVTVRFRSLLVTSRAVKVKKGRLKAETAKREGLDPDRKYWFVILQYATPPRVIDRGKREPLVLSSKQVVDFHFFTEAQARSVAREAIKLLRRAVSDKHYNELVTRIVAEHERARVLVGADAGVGQEKEGDNDAGRSHQADGDEEPGEGLGVGDSVPALRGSEEAVPVQDTYGSPGTL